MATDDRRGGVKRRLIFLVLLLVPFVIFQTIWIGRHSGNVTASQIAVTILSALVFGVVGWLRLRKLPSPSLRSPLVIFVVLSVSILIVLELLRGF